MKKETLSMVAMSLLAATSVVFVACDELESATERGAKAGKECCECIKTKSQSECLKEVNRKYSNEISEAFVDAFNEEANKCGVEGKIVAK